MLRLLMIFTALTFVSDTSGAQTQIHLLRGLLKVSLIVESLGTNEKGCGLTEQAIRTAAMYQLSSAAVEVDHLADVVFYVNVTSLYLQADQICFSSIHVRANTYQTVTLEFSRDDKWAEIALWSSGYVASSTRSDHARYVSDVIEDKVKKFVTDWNLDNKPEVSAHGSSDPAGGPWNKYKGSPKQVPAEEAKISLRTAFAVTPSGDLVTNEHVVSRCSTVTVKQGSLHRVDSL
jgi:hypothetical protein